MMLRRDRLEAIASAVDAITAKDGLNCGEGLYIFTNMLITTLNEADEEVRDHMRDVVIECLRAYSEKPLSKMLVGLPERTH